MAYDKNNIFARILRGEIPCSKIYEDDHVLAFKDIHPQAKVHALVIPKGAYVSSQDFAGAASDAEIAAFVRAVAKVAKDLGVAESGYRVISNSGPDSHQEVPHYHVHILGGQPIGEPLPDWTPRAPIAPVTLTGRTVTLEPLGRQHLDDLWDALMVKSGPELWTYLSVEPFADRDAMAAYLDLLAGDDAFVPLAVVLPSGRAGAISSKAGRSYGPN